MRYAKTVAMGLLIAALAVGCNPPKEEAKKEKEKEKAHDHGKGPNGGTVIDFGKYHAEIDVKHDKKQMVVSIYDEDEKTPVAVAAKELTVVTKETKGKKGEVVKAMTITLKPADEKGGKATKFVGSDDGLAVEAEQEGTLFGEVNGKRLEAKFKEE